VLFADEPTASLDAANGQAVMQMLHGLVQESGVTLVIVTHDNRILHFADRILCLEDGRLADEPIHAFADEPDSAIPAAAPVARMPRLEGRVA
jgi:putative ABC transport system ATP-binding protein